MTKPTEFTPELATEICARIMSGRSLRSVTRDDDMPTNATVYRWLAENDAFAGQYARATDVRAADEFDRMFEIADTPAIGVKRKIDGDGKVETTEGDMIEHRRLQIDTRKWALARMNPRKYGDKVQLGGAADLPPIQTEDVTRDADEFSSRILRLASRAGADGASGEAEG